HEQPHAQGEVRSQGYHQDETGEHGAHDAPRRVDRVRAAHLTPARRMALGHEVGEQRESHPHSDRRNQDDGADGEAHGEETLGGAERLDLEYGDDVARQQAENEEQQTGARGGQRLGSGGAAVGASAREPESQSAIPPRARLMVAVAQRLARTPTYSIKKNPARAVPTTAPSVFSP